MTPVGAEAQVAGRPEALERVREGHLLRLQLGRELSLGGLEPRAGHVVVLLRQEEDCPGAARS